MRKIAYALIAIATVILLCVLIVLRPPDAEVVGRLKIPAHGIRAIVMAAESETCGCFPSLWNGGIVHVYDDLSPVTVGDMADLMTLDGGHMVYECIEIVPALHIGRWLVSRQGVVKANGDLIVFSAGKTYRFTML